MVIVSATGVCPVIIPLEFDETIGGKLVQLAVKVKFQRIDVFVTGIEMSQGIQFLPKRKQAHQIILVGNAEADFRIFEIGEDERLVAGLKLTEGGLELFLGVAAHLGEE